MSASTQVPVLFYSERCEASKEIVQTIQALNKASLFRFVCVDTTPRQYLPAELKSVPTVIVPQTREVVAGKASIFARISKPVDSRREVPQQRAPQAVNAEVREWSFNDAKGLSAGYSAFDDKFAVPEEQLRYSLIQGIRTSGQDAILPDGSVQSDPSKALESMEAMRNAEFKHSVRA